MKVKQPGEQAPEVKKYLKAVGKKLRLPGKIRRSVLSDLATGILARTEAGEPVEQILRDMGTPLQVAEGINGEMEDLVYVKSPWRWACLGLVMVCTVILLTRGYLGALLLLVNGLIGSGGAIGGLDGPTQIFVGTTAGVQAREMTTAALLLVMGVIGFVKLSRCHRRQE